MTITLTSQTEVTTATDGYLPTQEGDNPEMVYQQCQFSNGYQCYIRNMWGEDRINAEIQNVIDSFDSETPPTNWTPYDRYVAS